LRKGKGFHEIEKEKKGVCEMEKKKEGNRKKSKTFGENQSVGNKKVSRLKIKISDFTKKILI
jgi:hypothetical protein